MKTSIKILVVVDEGIDYVSDINESLEKQRQDYLTATDSALDVEWKIIRQDFSNLKWIEYGYGKDNYGVYTPWLYQDSGEKEGEHYSTAYVIDNSNWTRKGNQGIWGWSLGPAENKHIQLIRGMKGNVNAMYFTLLMELMHSWDNTYFKITRKRLEDVFMVQDYDEDIIHGRLPEYNTFQYIEVIRKMKDFLINLFSNTMLKLVKTESRPETYAILSDKKYWVVPDTMLHAGHNVIWDETDIKVVSDVELGDIPDGGVFGSFAIEKVDEQIK